MTQNHKIYAQCLSIFGLLLCSLSTTLGLSLAFIGIGIILQQILNVLLINTKDSK